MKNKEGTWEDIQLNMVRARKSFLLEARVERPSFFYEQPMRRILFVYEGQCGRHS